MEQAISNLTRKFIYFLAYGFGSGLLPKAPGTWGTLATIPLYLVLMTYASAHYLLITCVLTLLGIYICDVMVAALKREDPSEVVWDEVCGYLITMAFCPFSWVGVVGGFILFRVFDIWKPWPINWSERYFKGGFGVMIDDVIAAIYSGISFHLLVAMIQVFAGAEQADLMPLIYLRGIT